MTWDTFERRISRDVLIIVAMVLSLAAVWPAASRPGAFHGGIAIGGSGACPWAIDNGCAAAGPGSFQNLTFFTTAIDDGGANVLASHPMNWNVTGADFPVSFDPATVFVDPTTASLPGCSYNPNGQMVTGGPMGPVLSCSAIGADKIEPNVDMTGASSGGIGCIGLRIGASSDHAVIFTNSKFKLSGFCITAGAWMEQSGNFGIKIIHSQIDGDYLTNLTAILPLVDNGSNLTNTKVFDYDYMVNIGNRIEGGARGQGSLTIAHSYIVNYGAGTTAASLHGELALNGGQGATLAFDPIIYQGDTIVYPSATTGQEWTTTMYIATGTDAQSGVSALLDGNTVIVNKIGGAQLVGYGFFVQQLITLGSLTVTNNALYHNGANAGCGLNGPQTNAFTASTSGNTWTKTSGTSTIKIGQHIDGPGFTQATITGGSGNVWTFDGPPQTIAASSPWTVTPAIGTITQGNNIDLADGSAMTFTGPRLISGHC